MTSHTFVILSEAKDLAAKVFSERGEVLRFAQDDKVTLESIY
ncbi:MAG: hypothetical protein WCP21_00270 [Armatimonadota bacterium]